MSSTFPIMKPFVLKDTFESVILSTSPNYDPTVECTYLLDNQGRLLISSEKEFTEVLEIDPNHKIKVVSIVGNTGEGKSYTLNHTFFGGKEIFKTSPSHDPCTIGAMAKYNSSLKMICIDTEGFLGVSNEEHQRICFLQKICALSDVIIYRTKSEMLSYNMYKFLGDASRAYQEYFSPALQSVEQQYQIEKKTSPRRPSVIIFHETRYAKTLMSLTGFETPPEDVLRQNFSKVGESCDGFSSLHYIGVTDRDGEACFTQLQRVVENELQSIHSRSPKCIYHTLKVFDKKFQSHINHPTSQLNIAAFFKCQEKCLSCGAGCNLSMGHQDDNTCHSNTNICKLQEKYQNFAYFCKKCFNNGIKQIVKKSYPGNEQFWGNINSTVWSNYVIECSICGKIYESRKYWYGNKDPKDEAVVVDVIHIWPGPKSLNKPENFTQKSVGVISSITNIVANVASEPSKIICNWITNQIAPTSSRRNDEIFEYHQCRICGEGFCDGFSSKTQAVPGKEWHVDVGVRVCDKCSKEELPSQNQVTDDSEKRS